MPGRREPQPRALAASLLVPAVWNSGGEYHDSWNIACSSLSLFHGGMENREDRREETRLAVDSPAVVFWEDEEGAYQVKGRAVNLSGSGMGLRLRAPVRPGKIVWCAVPSYGIYSRAQVMHARGMLHKTAGVRFLAGQILAD